MDRCWEEKVVVKSRSIPLIPSFIIKKRFLVLLFMLIFLFLCNHAFSQSISFSYRMSFIGENYYWPFFTINPNDQTGVTTHSFGDDEVRLTFYLHVDSNDPTLSEVSIEFGPFESDEGKNDGPKYSIGIRTYPDMKPIRNVVEGSQFEKEYDPISLAAVAGESYKPYGNPEQIRFDDYVFQIVMLLEDGARNMGYGGQEFTSTVTVHTDGP